VAFIGEEPGISTNSIPCLIHSTSKLGLPGSGHTYNSVKSTNFILPSHAHYSASPASVAHTRSLGFLKLHLRGPIFDLEAIWDEHTRFEFEERDVEKTMSTMVAEPYVNHVPTVRYLPLLHPYSLLRISFPLPPHPLHLQLHRKEREINEILDDRRHRQKSTNRLLPRPFHFQ